MGRRTFLLGAGAAVCAAAGLALRRVTSPAAADSTPEPSADPNPALPAGEWRAVWVSYLEWAAMDFSTEDAFRAGVVQLLDNCTGLGLNAVLAQVRPFGDALYRSSLFPWSHLCTGVQGQDPGFDPLDVLLQEAHTRGISVEAWVNPYRLRSSAAMPPNLADSNLANTHPEWVCTVDEGLYLNPAEPAAADYVVQGVAELVQNYAVDGIHFDDYFYPTTDESIDAAQFAASGAGNLAAWRRENVTALVRAVHDTVKAADPTLRFGISPQGNPDNDENQQYSDVTGWLASGGGDAVVDYLCPQVYWGQGFALHNGSTRFAFENIVPAWLAYPRAADVALYFGLGAYRVGVGDGGSNENSLSGWSTGRALADQVAFLREQGAGGWALYRYGSLFGPEQTSLAAAECGALAAADGKETA
ncbi:MAG: family 10 glycosylhydrolase [Faecalibacterium sp.]|nr:family 10 glycosylhydrolase [Faecalibacterium sp.]